MINLVRRKSDRLILFAGDTYLITESGLVSSKFKAPTITAIDHEIAECESLPDDWQGGWYTYDGEWVLTDYGIAQKSAKEAKYLFDSITFDTLSSDTWTIPADGITHAMVTYTDQETVYFSVNETIHAVEPVDYVATLEITADAPGPIRIEVKDKQLIITALEVTL